MSSNLRPVCVVLLCQAVCTAAGLWIHHRIAIATAEWHVQESVAAKLESQATEILPAVERALATTAASDPAVPLAADALQRLEKQHQCRFLITNSDWNLTHASLAIPGIESGGPLSWHAHPGSGHNTSPMQSGVVLLDDRRYPATTFQVGERRFVLLPSEEHLIPTAAAITDALPMSGTITFVWINGLQAIIVYLVVSRLQLESKRVQSTSEEQVFRRAQELVRTQDAIIFGLAKLAESRDPDTGLHLERISLYSTQLAQALRRNPKFQQIITPQFVRLIGISSALHDIGKVGVRDSILLKPGQLTDSERSEMQKHAALGGECLKKIEQRLGSSNFLQMAREIALYHHERWDGQGYPHQLEAEAIPLAARIVAVADVYDALSMKRCYKPALEHDECVAMIREQSGRQFDPDVVKAFLHIESRFRGIAHQYSETVGADISGGSATNSEFTTELREILEHAGATEHHPPLSGILASIN